MNRITVWSLAVLVAADCLWVSIIFGATQLEPGQAVWTLFPLPGLYLLEIGIVGMLIPAVVWKMSPKWFAALPAAAGILLAFFVLGGFSLGPYLLPALVGLIALVILSAKESGASFTTSSAIFFGAAIGQAGIMLLLNVTHLFYGGSI